MKINYIKASYSILFFIFYIWLNISFSYIIKNSLIAQVITNSCLIIICSFYIKDIPNSVNTSVKKSIYFVNILLTICVTVISKYLYTVLNDQNFQEYNTYYNSISPIYLVCFSLFFAPVAEELVFRGIIFKYLRLANISFFASAVVSTVLFILVHGTLMHIIPAFILAMFFCIIYEYTNNIFYCIICHSMYNAIVIILNLFSINSNMIYSILCLIISMYCIIMFYKKLVRTKEGV